MSGTVTVVIDGKLRMAAKGAVEEVAGALEAGRRDGKFVPLKRADGEEEWTEYVPPWHVTALRQPIPRDSL